MGLVLWWCWVWRRYSWPIRYPVYQRVVWPEDWHVDHAPGSNSREPHLHTCKWSRLTASKASIIEATAQQWWVWTIAKVIAGASVGAVQATLPLYINEQAPTQIRGFLIVAYSLWFTLGGLAASIGLKFMQDADPLDYRKPIYTQFAMIGASAILFFFLPETPCKRTTRSCW